MRAVIDSNVWVSAAIRPGGPPNTIAAALALGRFTSVSSVELLAELERTLPRPKVRKRTGWSHDDELAFVAAIARWSTLVVPSTAVTVSRDPADDRVLEAALAGQADYIVTGDRDLLVLGTFEGVEIVDPAAFVAVLEGR